MRQFTRTQKSMKENEIDQTNTQSRIKPAALKIKGAASYLSISEITVRRLIERGLIKPNRALRHILISKAELDRFLSL
jgi:excisionase family DNA binding protein